MVDHARNKKLTALLIAELADAQPTQIASVLRSHCSEDVAWEIFHPFNSIRGVDAAAERFWEPLKVAFPDYEHRLNLIIGGEYEGRQWVSTLGHVMGSFERPWVGIPPTHGLAFLRIGMNLLLEGGRLARAYVLLDVIDLMRQAGFYPLRQMPGTPEQWPAPPCTDAADPDHHDAERGAKTLRATREMLSELYSGLHSRHWHEHMNWYGPAGIGSTRGARGFYDYHCALWRQGLPDDTLFDRPPGARIDDVGPYILVGDGHYSVYAGWPNQHGTHLGGGLLGMAPTGRHLQLRVADWYRTDRTDHLIDNWVMIDVLDMLLQDGYDVLEDMRYRVDPSLPRHRHTKARRPAQPAQSPRAASSPERSRTPSAAR